MSQNDPLLALPMVAVRDGGILFGVSGSSAAASDGEWVTPGEKSQFSLAEDDSVRQPTRLKESPSTQDDVEPTKTAAMRTVTTQLSQCSITLTAAHPGVTMIGETIDGSHVNLFCDINPQISCWNMATNCSIIPIMFLMVYACLHHFSWRFKSKNETEQAVEARGSQKSAQDDSCRSQSRPGDVAAERAMNRTVFDEVVNAASRRLRERKAQPWANISPQELSVGVLAVLQGLNDVVMPASKPIEVAESDDVNKLARKPTSAGDAGPVTAAETTREVSEPGSSSSRGRFVEPDSNDEPAPPQLQDADDQASRPQHRASELHTTSKISSNPQQRPESRLDDDNNATVREEREIENADTGGHESPLERDVDLQPEQNTASDEHSPATQSSHIPVNVPRSSPNAAMPEAHLSSTLDRSLRNGNVHDRNDATSAGHRTDAPHPADQGDVVTSIEPADLIETLSFDEQRRESAAAIWAPSSDPHVVLPKETAMAGRSMSAPVFSDATAAREDLETVVEAVARQRSERSLSNPLPLPSPPPMQPSVAPDIGGEGRRSFEAAF
ncbi:hypothetical protein CB0940_01298 [Cercospora beticola]|uniref:Uncharacterized protein n=1 Tax=Cercospora beticola TaxID=122368 RepID=A0A2G5I6M6_CERBT|nr:hypothetical protein CB0940_01298 [Cercospora beticola]PIB00451.1 hypothetical protein CB0940_01298 [Cercospora beticola]WPA96732.1 hypothetical protein RHO25_001340 [Cercospora beticola]